MSARVGTGAAVATTVLALAVLAAAPAHAHDRLQSTSPRNGSTVAVVPGAVSLTFDKPAIALGTAVRVVGPSGTVSVGKPVLVDNGVRQTLRAGAPAGGYTVNWRVTSIDGHPITGSYSFTAKAASPATKPSSTAVGSSAASPLPTSTDAPTKRRSNGRTALIAGALGALAGLGIVLFRRRGQASS